MCALDFMNAVFLFPFKIKNVAWQYFPIVIILVLLAYIAYFCGKTFVIQYRRLGGIKKKYKNAIRNKDECCKIFPNTEYTVKVAVMKSI